ncbi:MAG: hypothetical protein Q9162_001618 [Coniocarpon cinnabarinum]
MAPKGRDGDVVLSFSANHVSVAHTIAAYAAFVGAFIVGVWLHYTKIVENEHYGYPDEWFPSVSATIGDRYPERSVFMVFIAITSGPRFALVGLWYLLTRKEGATLPKVIAGVGLFRTLTCGGWTYVTSTDDHDWHDIFMISYLVATLPWTLGCLALSPPNPRAIQYRKAFAGTFFATIVPLIYFFIQHKVHKIAGAYTTYAFFEWSLVLLDVAFDAVTFMDFLSLEVIIRDVKGLSRGPSNQPGVADRVLEKHREQEAATVFGHGFSWNEALDAIADIYNGYVFWSMLTSLGLLVWYFPLWHMGISGYEAFVLSTMGPVLLGIPAIRRLVIKNLRYTHLLSLCGVLSWLVPPPELRLLTVGIGLWMACLSWTATFYAERSQPHRLEARATAFGSGLILSSIAKFACQTNNPLWPVVRSQDGGWHKLGTALAVAAILRSTRNLNHGALDVPQPGSNRGSAVLSGLGISGVLFAMHALLSDSSTMILWTWTGWPVKGPISVPHGAYTIFTMSAGVVFGLFYPTLSRSWSAFGVGAVGAALIVKFNNWLGFYGGLILAFYVLAVAPSLISSAVRTGPAKTFGVGFFGYNFMVFFSVWVVAYAFVPGGPAVREHTDWVITSMMAMIGAGVFSANSNNPTDSKRAHKPPNPAAKRLRSYYIYALFAMQLLAASVAYLRFPAYDYSPAHPESNLVTAGIWTIHFYLDNPMWDSARRMRDLIKELEIDVLGLLESDTQRIIMGNRDPTQFLAEDLGMYVDYGPGPDKHTWGAALLSKFPILHSEHHLLPSPVGELAPAIKATIDAYGTEVDVFVFHSGQEEDVEDRRLQSEYLMNLMGKSADRPAVLLSYLDVKPGEGNYNNYVSNTSGMKDIDPSDWDRWCEYILYKNMHRTAYARVSRDSITDTELQVGKFVVGQPAGGNELVGEEYYPEAMRFPSMFRGEGQRGHRYHVFDEPRYYA